MAYNKAKEEYRWNQWKAEEEKILREQGVEEEMIQKLREYDWDDFKAERRFREHQTSLLDCMELLLEEKETKESQPESVEASMDKKDVEMIIPYLNGQDLPVWFDKYSIPVGTSITEQVQKGIEESDMVIFWVTDNFLKSNWCKMEMKVYIGRMIEENIRMFIVMDDEIEIKKLPLFLRDIKHLRREHRSVIEIAEEIAGIIKQM